MFSHRRSAVELAPLTLIVALAGCGSAASSVAASAGPASPSSSVDTRADLGAIGCATDEPDEVGDLTGAWAGDDGGVYYIRQVGDCVWWFGTELDPLEAGVTGQGGFANVAAGRVDGSTIELEWADVPVGDILGGGGLDISIASDDLLVVAQQRGDWGFGGSRFTRIEQDAGTDPSPGASATP